MKENDQIFPNLFLSLATKYSFLLNNIKWFYDKKKFSKIQMKTNVKYLSMNVNRLMLSLKQLL